MPNSTDFCTRHPVFVFSLNGQMQKTRQGNLLSRRSPTMFAFRQLTAVRCVLFHPRTAERNISEIKDKHVSSGHL